MNKYKVEITEYLQRVIEVDAESEEDAIALVKEDYRKENIVLDDFDELEPNSLIDLRVRLFFNLLKKYLQHLIK